MPEPVSGIESQIRNIERTYGRPLSYWYATIASSGLTKHPAVVAMLKEQHGLAHGAAHRLSILYRNQATAGTGDSPANITARASAEVRAIYDNLLAFVRTLGGDVEEVPKKGYVSLRRRKQFAMLKPGRAHVDLGLILPTTATTDRLEDAATFNRLFTHRVRVTSPKIDRQLKTWLRAAHADAG